MLDPDDEGAYDLVVAVAAGQLDDVPDIAKVLATFVNETSNVTGGR